MIWVIVAYLLVGIAHLAAALRHGGVMDKWRNEDASVVIAAAIVSIVLWPAMALVGVLVAIKGRGY